MSIARRMHWWTNSWLVALPVELVLGLAMAIGLVPCSTATRYLTAKSLSNNSSDSLAPSSDKHTDLAFVAGSEM
jgi:hypothetical protein